MTATCCTAAKPTWAVTVLNLSAREEDHAYLRHVLRRPTWALLEAHTCGEAQELARRNQVSVVICDADLPDGNWKDVLSGLTSLRLHPSLIVTSAEPDRRLWAEALNLGAHDLLMKPFDDVEVLYAVCAACRHWEAENLKSAS